MNDGFQFYVGIDWASVNHRVVLLDQEGRLIEQYDATHSGDGLTGLVNRLVKTCGCAPSEIGVAIEVSWGAVVDTLVDSGFAVFSINPKQVDRFRDRFTVAGAKDDTRDALVLADSLRTDQKSYKQVQVDDPLVIRLRELSRMDDELKEERRRLTNRLWEQLHRYYPQILQLSSGADDVFVWDLIGKAPTPAAASRLSRVRIQKVLASHRITRFTTDEVIAILRNQSLKLAPGAAEAASEHVLLLLPQILLLDQQVKDVGRRIERLLKELSAAQPDDSSPHDLSVMMSIPGLGPGIAAMLYGEASRLIRERDYEALRCYAGTAPVTKQSSKRKTVLMRHACSARIRQAMHHWANRSIMCDPRIRQQYDRSRANGQHHARAVRGLADRLLAVLISMLKQRQKYDPLHRLPTSASHSDQQEDSKF